MKVILQTEEKVFSYIREHHMLKAHDRVVAGISGGADSLCLLFVLQEWAKRVPLSLAAAHINHGIRPEAAEDAAHVEKICAQQGIPFFLTEADVRGRAEAEKCSLEEAGRSIRYEAFYRAAEEFGAEKIAVAHNKNDNSETMLFHLFRGSGLKGLCGILPVRDRIVRPLLCLEREEIENYLRQKGVVWCEDATNREDDYTRNRIRHYILPYAEREIASGCVTRMAQTAEILEETEGYLEEQTLAAVKRCTAPEDASCAKAIPGKEAARVEVDVSAFLKEHAAIRKRILFLLVKGLAPSQRDIAYIHIKSLSALFEKETGKTVQLPFGIRGSREYGRVILSCQEAAEEETDAGGLPEKVRCGACQSKTETAAGDDERVINMEQLGSIPVRVDLKKGYYLEFLVLPGERLEDFPEKECTKWFDCDKIKKSLAVRTRRTGDYLTIADGRGGVMHKSVKDYMITAKIPREQREKIPLLAEGQHILWMPGHRISEYYKIGGNTKRILQVQLRRSREDGKMEESYGGES